MIEITADIFSVHANPGQTVWKICPTNGTVKENGEAVMGSGIAKELAAMYPNTPIILGACLEVTGNIPHFLNYDNTQNKRCLWYSFPVKHHWSNKADPQLISLSLIRFKRFLYERESKGPDFVVFPRVGCGNGKLNWQHTVRPMMLDAFENDNRVVVVSLPF